MSRALTAAALTLALGLAACVTPTPYQAASGSTAIGGGYAEQKLDDTHYRVSFRGNIATPQAQVESYLLYRAAELTQSAGGDWFEMADQTTHDNATAWTTPAFEPRWGYWRPHWTWYHVGWDDDYETERQDSYLASAVIAIGHGALPAGDPKAFDARQVLANLGPTIQRPH
jgi:hypothetical protein